MNFYLLTDTLCLKHLLKAANTEYFLHKRNILHPLGGGPEDTSMEVSS